MTNLKCNVCDCASNKNNCCCRPSINVEGKEACCCDDTCCQSYQEKSSAASNSIHFDAVNQNLEVSCRADNCTHNLCGKCTANSINITQGTQGTECASFQNR